MSKDMRSRGSPRTMQEQQQSCEPDQTPTSPEEDKEEWIGQQLRKVYDETLNEPIPERFLELLKQIDNKKQNAG